MEGFGSKQIIRDPDPWGLITYRPDPLHNTEDNFLVYDFRWRTFPTTASPLTSSSQLSSPSWPPSHRWIISEFDSFCCIKCLILILLRPYVPVPYCVKILSMSVLWIRIGFNADPDPDFYLNTDPDPGRQTNADLCGSGSWSNFKVTKSRFLHEKYT